MSERLILFYYLINIQQRHLIIIEEEAPILELLFKKIANGIEFINYPIFDGLTFRSEQIVVPAFCMFPDGKNDSVVFMRFSIMHGLVTEEWLAWHFSAIFGIIRQKPFGPEPKIFPLSPVLAASFRNLPSAPVFASCFQADLNRTFSRFLHFYRFTRPLLPPGLQHEDTMNSAPGKTFAHIV